jgi:hypothetical protein
MRRSTAFVGLSLLVACGTGGAAATGDGGSTVSPSGPGPDAGTPYTFPEDGGDGAVSPLLSPCDPTSATSCPTGFFCFAAHTSATWWVDLYGKCTFVCSAASLATCSGLDGVCGCPVSAAGVVERCVATEDGGLYEEGGALAEPDGGPLGVTVDPPDASMVCVPSVKPGTTPGSTEGDGGCGTPGCGGGSPVTTFDGGDGPGD